MGPDNHVEPNVNGCNGNSSEFPIFWLGWTYGDASKQEVIWSFKVFSFWFPFALLKQTRTSQPRPHESGQHLLHECPAPSAVTHTHGLRIGASLSGFWDLKTSLLKNVTRAFRMSTGPFSRSSGDPDSSNDA